jgi:hypothetical protein
MRKVCAWCQDPMDDEPQNAVPITHGICDRCARNALPAYPAPALLIRTAGTRGSEVIVGPVTLDIKTTRNVL